MFESDDLSIECATCVAAGTTACGDCVVTHLLANDDGPIEFVVTPVRVVAPVSAEDRAVGWFAAAGLVDDPPGLIDRATFEPAANEGAVR